MPKIIRAARPGFSCVPPAQARTAGCQPAGQPLSARAASLTAVERQASRLPYLMPDGASGDRVVKSHRRCHCSPFGTVTKERRLAI
jgi:hypothetical protein